MNDQCNDCKIRKLCYMEEPEEDWTCDHYEPCEYDEEDVTDINAGTKLGTDLAEVGTDCISRQAAIDGKICIRRSNGVEIYDDYVVPVEYLEQLPPAQPEIIRCKDCRHRDEFGCCKYWVGLTMGMPTTATDDDDFCSHAERRTE